VATAKAREVTKTRMVEEHYTTEDGVILELTHEEAALVVFILGHRISGGGLSKARKLADGIWDRFGPLGYHFRGKHYKDVSLFEADFEPGYLIAKKGEEIF
jgi:hypothetical protein